MLLKRNTNLQPFPTFLLFFTCFDRQTDKEMHKAGHQDIYYTSYYIHAERITIFGNKK